MGSAERLEAHATHFADGGIAALIFDYRNFGESEGEPRQLVEIAGQQHDIGSAVGYVRSRSGIDPERVALWGNSLGGGHVFAVAADDPRIAALIIAQSPYNGFPRRKEARQSSGRKSEVKLAAAIFWDARRSKLHLKPYYIQMVGGPGELAVAAGEDADRIREFLSGGNVQTSWKNEVAPRALLPMARFKPSWFAPRVQAPVLVCAAEHDLAPPETVRPLADLAPHGELRVFPGTLFVYYLDAEFRGRVLEEQLALLQHHLVASPESSRCTSRAKAEHSEAPQHGR